MASYIHNHLSARRKGYFPYRPECPFEVPRVVFVDRDGTILCEPDDEQIDSLEKFSFVPGAISGLKAVAGMGYRLVLVSNQDGLGTDSFPEETFWPAQNLMLEVLQGEGVVFDDILIDRSFPEEGLPTRKPGTGMLGAYMDGSVDLANSFVVGDRPSDRDLARNLGARSLLVTEMDWPWIVREIRFYTRCVLLSRRTRETSVDLCLDLDGRSIVNRIDTGLKFFDHMLEQIPHHSGMALALECRGDLQVDEHHTIEDCAIVLGQAVRKALGDKMGIGRYGFALPMDDCDALVLLDFGDRIDFAWRVPFTREKVGDTPTEMFRHFFQSFASEARCNLHIEARGENNHHLAECVFKAFARALKQAVRRDPLDWRLPSSKGLL